MPSTNDPHDRPIFKMGKIFTTLSHIIPQFILNQEAVVGTGFFLVPGERP
jgi:hypothetical protein